MKFIKKERQLDSLFNSEREYWELQGGFTAIVSGEHNDNILSILINDNKENYLPPVERCRKEEQFARKIQKNIKNIKIDYGIDAVYMVCAKDELKDVLAEIERHINNQTW